MFISSTRVWLAWSIRELLFGDFPHTDLSNDSIWTNSLLRRRHRSHCLHLRNDLLGWTCLRRSHRQFWHDRWRDATFYDWSCHIGQIFARTMPRKLSGLFYSTNLFKYFFQVVIISEMYWKANWLSIENYINAWFSNVFSFCLHCLKHFANEVINGEGLKSHYNTTFQVCFCECFQGFVLEDETYGNPILVSGFICNFMTFGDEWTNSSHALLMCCKICRHWSLSCGRHFGGWNHGWRVYNCWKLLWRPSRARHLRLNSVNLISNF